MEFKKGDSVKVVGGKFRGWIGSISEREYDRKDKKYYYSLYPYYKKKRSGDIKSSDVGLSEIINLTKNKLLKIDKFV